MPLALPNIDDLYNKNFINRLDLEFGRFIKDISGQDEPCIALCAALVSMITREGNVCLDMKKPFILHEIGDKNQEKAVEIDLSLMLDRLKSSNIAGRGNDFCPLIIDEKDRLYLHKYWHYQDSLAKNLLSKAARLPENIDRQRLSSDIEKYFGAAGSYKQKLAVETCANKNLCIITGGPGTGKTWTVVKIIAILLEQNRAQNRDLKIVLAAPTGKAAARLIQAVRDGIDQNFPKEIRELFPAEAFTIHRLMGAIPGSSKFIHTPQNPIDADVLIIDESSMVDLAMMSKVADALKPEAKLILIGDKDQLASVEAGYTLADISAGKDTNTPLGTCIINFEETYRFSGGIAKLSNAVNRADYKEALETIENSADIWWTEIDRYEILTDTLKDIILKNYSNYLKENDPLIAIELFERFNILCALKKGGYGVESINLLAEKVLIKNGLINPKSMHYRGRPVLITKNSYTLGLFNGDIGITLQDQISGQLYVYFKTYDGKIRRFLTSNLPEHETAYCMTVHKSQGSEFESIAFVLPDADSAIITRELIYTGLTRAKKRVLIMGKKQIFKNSLLKKIQRQSGLKDALLS